MPLVTLPIASPCMRQCQAHAGACLACGRTLIELRDWSNYSPDRRREIMDFELPLRQRLRMLSAPTSGQRLGPPDASRVLTHLLGLSRDDRRSRFGYVMSDESLNQWVGEQDWEGQWIWHLHSQTDPIIGLLFLAADGRKKTWSAGLSVDQRGRGLGWGRILLREALRCARLVTPDGALRLNGAADNKALVRLCSSAQNQIVDGQLISTFNLSKNEN